MRRANTLHASSACRWDNCWIRLLDGMLQLSVAGTRDYELRIPTRIRSIVINNAAGTDDGQISVRYPCTRHIFDPAPELPGMLLHIWDNTSHAYAVVRASPCG